MFRCKIYLVWPVRLWQGIRRQKAQNTGEASQNLVMGCLQSFLGYSGSFWSSYNGLVRGMKTGVGVSFSSFWKTVTTTPHRRGSPPLLPVEVVPVLKTAVNTQRLGRKWHGGWCTTSPFPVWARGCGAGAAKGGQTGIWGLSLQTRAGRVTSPSGL